MAKRVTQDDIIKFNILYKQIGTYAGVARKTGFSAGTVRKYIIQNFEEPKEEEKITWNGTLREPGSFEIFPTIWLDEEEKKLVEELRKEILI